MEQQQFRVSFSLSTKLLMSVVTMLLVIIGFLTVATIVVLSEDKRAYTFQSQGTEALLAGREFANISGRSSAALKLLLSNYDPSKPISAAERQAMQGIIDNQSDLVLVRVGKFVPAENRFEAIETIELKDALVTANQKAEDFTIAPEWFPIASPGLLKNSIYMINTSRPGYASRALLLADTKYQSADGSLPMAIGFSPIKDLSKEFRNSRITIANSDGYVLFDSDNSVQFSAGNVTNDPIFQKALKAPVASGAGEFRIGEDRILASYGRPGMDLIVTSRMDWKKAMSATYRLAEKFILLGLICTSAAVIFALIFAKSLTAPLLELYKATKDVAAGQFELNLQPRTRDEIGALGASFGVMSRKIQELIKEKMRAVQIENELALASAVQQTLIPPNRYQDPRIEISSIYQSASQCGGDWWGMFNVGNRLCLMIADATGHGIPSALITASARSCFSVMHKLAQEDPNFACSPGNMLAYANRVIHEAASGQIMMTFFACVLDFDSNTLSYANAAHNPPWFFAKTENGFKLNSLTPDGPRLGETLDIDPYPEKTLRFSKGDMLFLYTDGLPEGKNLNTEQFGKKRLKNLVEGSLTQGPSLVIEQVMRDFMEYNTGKELDDDVTMAVARIL